jgi:lipid II:glycine glycyltransferase (peptidoglycan interpeptide bridge formation enzyme)
MTSPGRPGANERDWDGALERLGGHLLQSWRWGEFKSRHGWEAERHISRDGAAAAQVLFRRRGPFVLGYVPRGPAVAETGTNGFEELVSTLDAACRRRKAAQLIIEPDRALPLGAPDGLLTGPEHFQPSRTVKVPLLDDEALLQQMHQKTRYSVRLAMRKGVEIRRSTPTDDAVNCFYTMLQETSDRNEFGIHTRGYYRDFLETFGDHALFLIAYAGGEPAAALISAKFGKEAVYMYGASSTANRAHGAAFALQFEAMRWARDHGCETYDLWGIPAVDPVKPDDPDGRVAGSRGDDWRGLFKFKTGFGGTTVSYPPTLERRYRPMFVLGMRLASRGRGA